MRFFILFSYLLILNPIALAASDGDASIVIQDREEQTKQDKNLQQNQTPCEATVVSIFKATEILENWKSKNLITDEALEEAKTDIVRLMRNLRFKTRLAKGSAWILSAFVTGSLFWTGPYQYFHGVCQEPINDYPVCHASGNKMTLSYLGLPVCAVALSYLSGKVAQSCTETTQVILNLSRGAVDITTVPCHSPKTYVTP